MVIGRRLGLFKGLAKMIRFLKDSQVPFVKKLPVIAWVLYLIAPIDFLPDPVLGIGIIDDAVLLAFVLNYLNRQIEGYKPGPKGHGDSNDSKVIEDIEYHVSEDEHSDTG
jgi:uncharacterized membrane protein YkvA (DUF1232 family)